MSTTTNRDTSLHAADSVDQRLTRLLDTTFLTRVVPHLAPETLHRLIRYRGLDACGELLTSATPVQLTALLDLDLWRHAAPGHDERFDVERFGEWLEVLVDTGEAAAARIVAALDTQVVVAGLSRYLRVFDPGTFEPTESSDDEAMDRHRMMSHDTSSDVLECEVGGYLVRARRTDAWDAVVALLVALDAGHGHCFHAVMQGCRRLSNSRPEVDGLDDLLMTPEQHLHDMTAEREQRRSRLGYAAPADARAFLQAARLAQTDRNTANPIATAYFRVAAEEAEAAAKEAADTAAPRDHDISAPIDAVVELLAEAGVRPERLRALPAAADEDPRTVKLPLLRRLMDVVLHHDEGAYLTRSRELAFLANTLLAGGSVQSRPFTPDEASDAAASVCNLGLECVASLPDAFLVDHGLVAAFEAGWSKLYRDVSLFATDRLVSVLAALHCGDADTRHGLRVLQRALETQRQAGTPWLARDAADVLAGLDMTAWIGVLGVLDECPILPAALTAVLERRTTSVSPTEFRFISTAAQIDDVHAFMARLPGVLSS